jgi:hypothetical protein
MRYQDVSSEAEQIKPIETINSDTGLACQKRWSAGKA